MRARDCRIYQAAPLVPPLQNLQETDGFRFAPPILRWLRGLPILRGLASVTDTCRKRGHVPWRYLEKAIAERRAGLPLSPLPVPHALGV